MSTQVTLMVTSGDFSSERFVFGEPTKCLVGRARDCLLRLSNDEEHLNISRHHCLLNVDPPQVRVRDLGSRNGTYLNGEKIGQRSRLQTVDDAASEPWPELILKEGDEIRLGNVVIRVGIAEHVLWD